MSKKLKPDSVDYEFDHNVEWAKCGIPECPVRCVYYINSGRDSPGCYMQCDVTFGGVIYCSKHQKHSFHPDNSCVAPLYDD